MPRLTGQSPACNCPKTVVVRPRSPGRKIAETLTKSAKDVLDMGLFSNMRGKPATSGLDAIAKSILTMPLLVSAADGRIDKPEIEEIVNICSISPIFVPLGPERMVALIKEIVTDLSRRGAEAIFVEAAEGLSPALRETAICFAIRVAIADGYMAKEEDATLRAMAQRLNIAPAVYNGIIDVMAMLQRPAAA